jgi:uncharacterized protein (DUF1684 family)
MQEGGREPGLDRAPYLELLDYRNRVAELYREARAGGGTPDALERFRRAKDELVARHPMSPLPPARRNGSGGLSYYRHVPGLRFELQLDMSVEPETLHIALRDDGELQLERFAQVHFRLADRPQSLSLFWLRGYGGGLFLPFGDPTNGDDTYGGGRYLLDTVKGSYLGQEGGKIIIDFNYAYNPSCAYDARWHCPLTPPENRLDVEIAAGEKGYSGQ